MLDAVEFGGDVGFGDAEDVGDFRVGAVFEIEQDESAIQGIELFDEGSQSGQAFVFAGVSWAGRNSIEVLPIERLGEVRWCLAT